MITIVTHHTENWEGIGSITVPIMKEYCKKHGYEYSLILIPDYEKYDGLIKLWQAKNNLINEGDIVFSLDSDCLITNFENKVEYFLKNGKDFYVCEGLNMGSFIIKKTGWSERMLNTMISLIMRGEYNCEQDAIEDFIKHENIYTEPLEIVKHPAFNSYLSELYPEIPQPVTEENGQWIAGKSFILHLPALSIEKRVSILKEKVKEIVYE